MNVWKHIPVWLVLSGVLVVGARLPIASALGADEGVDPRVSTAATISITNPTDLQVTVPEGDDFATQALGDPWDMNERRDIGYEIGFGNVSVSNGVWDSTFSGVDQASGAATSGYFFPLFQGFSSPVNTVQGTKLSQELMWNKVGAQDKYAVDPTRYKYLSFRIYTSDRSQYYVRWTTQKPVIWPDDTHAGDSRFGGNDGCYRGNSYYEWPNGWRAYFFDLSQNNGEDTVRQGNWPTSASTPVRGIRIDPSSSNVTAGSTNVKVDWVRLTDPTASTSVTINWSASGTSASDLVDLWVANDSSGNDVSGSPVSSPLIRGLPYTNGSYSFPTTILSPGAYYFQLKLMANDAVNKGCSPTAEKANSGWVGPLTITQAPRVEITTPSMTSGEDYATAQLGNPWDMNNSSDIIYRPPPYPVTIANQSFSNGIYSGDAIILPGDPESDAQILLNTTGHLIDTSKYRYFSIRFRVNAPAGKDINWLIARGWGGRMIWWNNNSIETAGSETKFAFYYEGWHTYPVDLARALVPASFSNPNQTDNILIPTEENPNPAQVGWTQVPSFESFRYDMLETRPEALGTGADHFEIDWIRLTARDEVVRGGPYSVRYNVLTSPAPTLNFYYTTDPSVPTQNTAQMYTPPALIGPNFLYLPLTLRNFVSSDYSPGGASIYAWDTGTAAAGTYYICVRATSQSNTSTTCSEAPVVVK